MIFQTPRLIVRKPSPADAELYFKPVHHYIYRVFRQDWLALNALAVAEDIHQRWVPPAEFETALE